MSYKLLVSRNCGISYHLEAEADDPSAFADQCKELDAVPFRWVIEDEDGTQLTEPAYMCRMHKEILGLGLLLSQKQEDE